MSDFNPLLETTQQEIVTSLTRFVDRGLDSGPVLQSMWQINTIQNDQIVRQEEIWRDVPTISAEEEENG